MERFYMESVCIFVAWRDFTWKAFASLLHGEILHGKRLHLWSLLLLHGEILHREHLHDMNWQRHGMT